MGYFTTETIPSEYCDRHITVDYCTIGKGVACDSCPASAIKKVSLVRIEDRSFPIWTKITDAQYVYRQMSLGDTFRYGESYAFYESKRQTGEYYGTSSVTASYNRVCHTHYVKNAQYQGTYNKQAVNTTIPVNSLNYNLGPFPELMAIWEDNHRYGSEQYKRDKTN